jgi:uncharacterized protein (TIGR04255 family)
MKAFPRAPIQEALLDLQVQLPEGSVDEVLISFQDGIEERFPTKKDIKRITQNFELSPQNGIQTFSTPVICQGYQYISDSNQKIVQARSDGFTFNKLRPYSDWKTFSEEAHELWKKYVEVVKPISINRIGLRYINRIEIPIPFSDFREYCLLFPDFPQEIPQKLSEFFMRFATPSPGEHNISTVVNLTFEPVTNDSLMLPLIFDIDTFSLTGKLDPKDSLTWTIVDELREIKNQIFDSSLTEKCKKLFL